MTILKPNPVSEKQFLHYANKWSADMSDTKGLGAVYDDSCDEGLTIVMADGRELVFVVHNVEYNKSEGELLYWELETLRGERLQTLILFND